MSDSYYKIEEMNGYYRIGSPEAVFCYVIVGKEKAMLTIREHAEESTEKEKNPFAQ